MSSSSEFDNTEYIYDDLLATSAGSMLVDDLEEDDQYEACTPKPEEVVTTIHYPGLINVDDIRPGTFFEEVDSLIALNEQRLSTQITIEVEQEQGTPARPQQQMSSFQVETPQQTPPATGKQLLEIAEKQRKEFDEKFPVRVMKRSGSVPDRLKKARNQQAWEDRLEKKRKDQVRHELLEARLGLQHKINKGRTSDYDVTASSITYHKKYVKVLKAQNAIDDPRYLSSGNWFIQQPELPLALGSALKRGNDERIKLQFTNIVQQFLRDCFYKTNSEHNFHPSHSYLMYLKKTASLQTATLIAKHEWRGVRDKSEYDWKQNRVKTAFDLLSRIGTREFRPFYRIDLEEEEENDDRFQQPSPLLDYFNTTSLSCTELNMPSIDHAIDFKNNREECQAMQTLHSILDKYILIAGLPQGDICVLDSKLPSNMFRLKQLENRVKSVQASLQKGLNERKIDRQFTPLLDKCFDQIHEANLDAFDHGIHDLALDKGKAWFTKPPKLHNRSVDSNNKVTPKASNFLQEKSQDLKKPSIMAFCETQMIISYARRQPYLDRIAELKEEASRRQFEDPLRSRCLREKIAKINYDRFSKTAWFKRNKTPLPLTFYNPKRKPGDPSTMQQFVAYCEEGIIEVQRAVLDQGLAARKTILEIKQKEWLNKQIEKVNEEFHINNQKCFLELMEASVQHRLRYCFTEDEPEVDGDLQTFLDQVYAHFAKNKDMLQLWPTEQNQKLNKLAKSYIQTNPHLKHLQKNSKPRSLIRTNPHLKHLNLKKNDEFGILKEAAFFYDNQSWDSTTRTTRSFSFCLQCPNHQLIIPRPRLTDLIYDITPTNNDPGVQETPTKKSDEKKKREEDMKEEAPSTPSIPKTVPPNTITKSEEEAPSTLTISSTVPPKALKSEEEAALMISLTERFGKLTKKSDAKRNREVDMKADAVVEVKKSNELMDRDLYLEMQRSKIARNSKTKPARNLKKSTKPATKSLDEKVTPTKQDTPSLDMAIELYKPPSTPTIPRTVPPKAITKSEEEVASFISLTARFGKLKAQTEVKEVGKVKKEVNLTILPGEAVIINFEIDQESDSTTDNVMRKREGGCSCWSGLKRSLVRRLRKLCRGKKSSETSSKYSKYKKQQHYEEPSDGSSLFSISSNKLNQTHTNLFQPE